MGVKSPGSQVTFDTMKVLLVEPPRDVWFIMGEYLPPPYGIIQLGAYLERELPEVEVEVLDCNAKRVE